jgi:serine/threonine protein kinase
VPPPDLTDFPVKANILIDQTGHARLADFGLLTIISDPTNLLASSSYAQGGTARWMSPELIAPQRFGLKSSRPTKYSDCYALGMVIYETISGNLPFHKHSDLTVFLKVVEGERPPRGVNFRKGLWRMLEQCWGSQPNHRPTIEDVLRNLEVLSNSSDPPSPEVDEGMEMDGDDWDSKKCSPGSSNGGSGARTPTSSGLSEEHHESFTQPHPGFRPSD